jgi:negative regulator of flagellin synthesis FlgM
MEINGRDTLIILNTGVKRVESSDQPSRIQKQVVEDSSLGSDRVELSVRGSQISNLDEMIRSTPDIHEARVEEVKKALESGTYNVKAEMIADKIIGGNLLDEIF